MNHLRLNMVGDKKSSTGENLGPVLDRVLNSVREWETLSYLEIQRRTGLPAATLDDALETLERLGLVTSQNVHGVVHYGKPMPPRTQEWYTVNEAAQYLRVSRRTIYQLVKENQLAPYKVGRAGHRRFRQQDIDAVMRREQDITESSLTASDDPVLAELWNNDIDAEYDKL